MPYNKRKTNTLQTQIHARWCECMEHAHIHARSATGGFHIRLQEHLFFTNNKNYKKGNHVTKLKIFTRASRYKEARRTDFLVAIICYFPSTQWMKIASSAFQFNHMKSLFSRLAVSGVVFVLRIRRKSLRNFAESYTWVHWDERKKTAKHDAYLSIDVSRTHTYTHASTQPNFELLSKMKCQ